MLRIAIASKLFTAVALGLAIAAAAAAVLASPPGGASAAPATTRTFTNPPGGCQAWTFDIVHLAAHPNLGATYPNALVKRGTPVQLVGTAERQQRLFDCSVTYTALPFAWSATFQANDGSAPVAGDDHTPQFYSHESCSNKSLRAR